MKRLSFIIRSFIVIHFPRLVDLKPSDLCIRAARIVKQDKACGGCTALALALGAVSYQEIIAAAANDKCRAAKAAFEVYKPADVRGLYWWLPVGPNPSRINALLNAAYDLRLKGQ